MAGLPPTPCLMASAATTTLGMHVALGQPHVSPLFEQSANFLFSLGQSLCEVVRGQDN